MSMMSDLHVDVAYGAPEMNKEYLDNIINGNALDDPITVQNSLPDSTRIILPDNRQDNLPNKSIQDVAKDALMA